MNALVTGGCGFIGHHLVNRLLDDGHTVHVLDNMSGAGSTQRSRDLLNRRHSKPYVVTCDSAVTKIHVNPGEFDVIYHLAAVSRTVPAMEDPNRCMMTNVMGTVSMLDAARHLGCRLVVSSSNVVYAADTPYKASKLMMEEACKAYHETYGVSVVCLRYSNVYGPGFAKGDAACLAAMRDSYRDRGYLEVTGDGQQTRDFTHVEDIVRGNLLAAESGYCGTVDLCTGENTSMNDAGYFLLLKNPDVLPGAFEKYVKRIPDRKGDVKHIVQDPEPAKKILGWTAKVKFEDGVKDVWRY